MRAVLQAAVRQRSLLRGGHLFRLSTAFSRLHFQMIDKTSLSTSAAQSEVSTVHANTNGNDLTGVEIDRVDKTFLFDRLNCGLNSGSIKSGEVLEVIRKLNASGATIPIGFILDAGEGQRHYWQSLSAEACIS